MEKTETRGRPTLFREEYVKRAFEFCLLGATDAKLAKIFEVDEATINAWKVRYPHFHESIRAGREDADANIAQSLYHRAKGYDYDDVHVSSYQGDVTITPIKRHMPAEVNAARLWLLNRQPKRWRDRVAVEHSGSVSLAALIGQVAEDKMIDVTPEPVSEGAPAPAEGATLPEADDSAADEA